VLTSKHVAEDNTAIDASSLTRQFLRLEPLCSTFHRSPCCSPASHASGIVLYILPSGG